MWDEGRLTTPQGFLGAALGAIPDDPELAAYQRWWAERGDELSAAVDRAGTPWLRMFDRNGTRVDEVCMPVGHRELLQRGYAAGIAARVFEHHSLLPFYRPGYVTAFHDPGLYCPYTVSLAEHPVERWVREAMIPSIWEGTAHRQILDGLEVMQRKGGHHALLEWLGPGAPAVEGLRMRLDRHLGLPAEACEAGAEGRFAEPARFAAESLRDRPQVPEGSAA